MVSLPTKTCHHEKWELILGHRFTQNAWSNGMVSGENWWIYNLAPLIHIHHLISWCHKCLAEISWRRKQCKKSGSLFCSGKVKEAMCTLICRCQAFYCMNLIYKMCMAWPYTPWAFQLPYCVINHIKMDSCLNKSMMNLVT